MWEFVCVSGMVQGQEDEWWCQNEVIREEWMSGLEWKSEWVRWIWVSLSLHSCYLNTRTSGEARCKWGTNKLHREKQNTRRQHVAQHATHLTNICAHTHTHTRKPTHNTALILKYKWGRTVVAHRWASNQQK